MAELETRLPCPVCIGSRMEKVWVAGGALAVDRCGRCGGTWFEQGEVQKVRQLEEVRTSRRLGASLDVSQAPCHACRAPIRRDAASCPACDHQALLACPHCDRAMAAAALGDLRLDVCSHCRGVWFDRHEIAAIWSARVDAVLAKRTTKRPSADTDGGVLLEAFAYSPDLVFWGAYAAGDLAASAGGALGDAASLAGGAAEVAGEAAASVFEVIVGIIGGIFS